MSVKEVYTVTCSALPPTTRVAGFRGSEGISRTYEFDVYLLLGDEGRDLDLADVVGAKAKLELSRADDRPPFVFHGIFAAFELIHEFDDRSLFHATLVPQLWQLTQTFHSRIWTKQSIKDIIADVLEDSGLTSSDYEFRLVQKYNLEEHVCQYQESNFDFISRWMEREGMYYYFEQGDDGEKVIITDSMSKQDALDEEAVRFFALGGHDGSAGESLHTFTCKHRALPASVKLKDYDYAKPTLDVSGEAPVSRVGIGEISVYGHRFFSPDEGTRLAKLRAEELLARQVVYCGTGTEFHLRAGYFFKLEDHPRSAFDQSYLATEVTHVGNQQISTSELHALTGIESDKVYWVEVKAIPATVQFRPARTTAWPRIYGFENGTVCGVAESDYAQIDDAGRYNVKFKFDESDLKDGKASTFVRMMQPHGGNPEGFHFPLRKGTEVLFTFLGGDPDRPVIAGVVPDTMNPSLVTNRNYTQNVIRTGGKNQIVMEDEQGKEFIFIQSPNKRTGIYLGHPAGDQSKIFTGDQPKSWYFTNPGAAATGDTNQGTDVGVSLWQTTDGNAGLCVVGDLWVNVWGTQNWFVYGAVAHGYLSTFTLDIGADSNEKYHAHRNTEITSGRTDKVLGGGMVQDIHGGLTQTIEPGGSSTVTGGWDHNVTATDTDHYGTWVSNIDNGWTATVGQAISITSTGASIEVKAPAGNVDVKGLGGHVNLQGSASIDITAPQVSVNGAQWKVKTSSWFDWYSAKGAAGIFKMDEAAIYQCAYGLKIDTNGIKVENESCKKITGGMFLRAYAMSKKTALFGLADYAIGIWNGAFKKE